MSHYCARCDEWLGLYGQHDPDEHGRLVAIERALDHMLDALIGPDGWDSDEAEFWWVVLGSLENAMTP